MSFPTNENVVEVTEKKVKRELLLSLAVRLRVGFHRPNWRRGHGSCSPFAATPHTANIGELRLTSGLP